MKFSTFLRDLNDDSGFSLVEIMISIGLLGMVSLSVVQITKDVSKVERKMNFDTSASAVLLQIRSALRNKIGCERTLVGKTPGGILEVLDGSPVPNKIAEIGKTYRGGGKGDEKGTGKGGIKIIEMRVHGPRENPGDPFPPPNSTSPDFTTLPNWKGPPLIPIWSYFTISYEKKGDQKKKVEQRSFPLLIQKNLPADGAAITHCYTNLDSFVMATCNSLNGVIDYSDTNSNDPVNDPIKEPFPCKNIAVAQTLGSTLASGHHDYAISSEGHIRVTKSLGVGLAGDQNPVDLIRPLATTKATQISFATNQEIGEVKVQNNAQFDGFGYVKLDMGVGNTAELQSSGNARINQSLTIGPLIGAETVTENGLWVKDYIGVGSSPIDPNIPSSLISGSGHMVIKNSTSPNLSKVMVGSSGDVGNGINDTVAGAPLHSLVTDKLIYIEDAQTSANVTNSHLITKGYFKQQLKTTLANPFDILGSNINDSLENATNTNVYNIVRSAICNYEVKVDSRVGGTNCTEYNSGLYNLTSSKIASDRTRFSLSKSTSPASSTEQIDIYNCSKSGNCSANPGICIGSGCRTTFKSSCPSGQFVVALGRGGGVGCANDSY